MSHYPVGASALGDGGAHRPRRKLWILLAALVVLALLLLSVAAGRAFGEMARGDGEQAVSVVRVIDGDTLVASVDGRETTIRLLNVDTPETKDPDKPVQCLGPEATEFLTELLPAGTRITLEYDVERTDRYGRTLAGVYVDRDLINAKIAAAGMGVPVLFEPNSRFLDEVIRASEQAQRDGEGLFAEDVDCALAGQLAQAQRELAAIPTAVTGDPATAVATSGDLLSTSSSLAESLDAGLEGSSNAVLAASSMAPYVKGLASRSHDLRARARSVRSVLLEQQDRYRSGEQAAKTKAATKKKASRSQSKKPTKKTTSKNSRPASRSATKDRSSRSSTSRSKKATAPRKSTGQQRPKSSTKSKHRSKTAGNSSRSRAAKKHKTTAKSSRCTPYGPVIPYSKAGGYTGKRYGMPGGAGFRKCR